MSVKEMTKMTVIRLPDTTGEEVEKYAKERGLAFATAVRCIVVEYLKIIAPTTTRKDVAGATNTPVKEVVA